MSNNWLEILAAGFENPRDMKAPSLAVGLVLGCIGGIAMMASTIGGGFVGLLVFIFGVIAAAIIAVLVAEFC